MVRILRKQMKVRRVLSLDNGIVCVTLRRGRACVRHSQTRTSMCASLSDEDEHVCVTLRRGRACVRHSQMKTSNRSSMHCRQWPASSDRLESSVTAMRPTAMQVDCHETDCHAVNPSWLLWNSLNSNCSLINRTTQFNSNYCRPGVRRQQMTGGRKERNHSKHRNKSTASVLACV